MKRVLFVCHGNICRSAMAEFMCRKFRSDLYCESLAVSYEEEGNDMYPAARRCLERHGVEYSRHRATRIKESDYDRFDEIYVMDDSNMRYINRIVNDKDHKIKMLCSYEIEDPLYTDRFDKVYEEIYEGIMNI